jgi:putative cardiolipin synthase
MACRFVDRVAEALPERTWEVFLDERDRIRWRGRDQDGQPSVLDHEPETSFWDRMAVGCLRLLPIRAQL